MKRLFYVTAILFMALSAHAQNAKPVTYHIGFDRAVSYLSDITPTALSANTDNYAPTNFSTSSVLRISASGAVNLTGLAAGTDGRVIVIFNVGANTITLKDENASSMAANRFALTGDVAIAQDGFAVLWYDSTSSRWRVMSS